MKPSNPNKIESSIETMKNNLLEGLVATNKTYIYLAYNDIFNPIGYEITPQKPLDAYKKL